MTDNRPKIISVDFDGVLHSYASGWQGVDVIPDPPVEGAMMWLARMAQDPRFNVQIYSARSCEHAGRTAMAQYIRLCLSELFSKGRVNIIMDQITFPEHKPPAFYSLDDRVEKFMGKFPAPDNILKFKPWYMLGPDDPADIDMIGELYKGLAGLKEDLSSLQRQIREMREGEDLDKLFKALEAAERANRKNPVADSTKAFKAIREYVIKVQGIHVKSCDAIRRHNEQDKSSLE